MKHLTDLQSLSWNHPLIKHSICYRDLYKPDPKTNRQINLHHCIWSLRVVYKQLHITHPYHNQSILLLIKNHKQAGFSDGHNFVLSLNMARANIAIPPERWTGNFCLFLYNMKYPSLSNLSDSTSVSILLHFVSVSTTKSYFSKLSSKSGVWNLEFNPHILMT